MNRQLYTVGHSNHSLEQFLGLLAQHGVTAVCDVRSSPYSRHHPQFNEDNLKVALKDKGVHYVPMGRELGARSSDPDCYEDGQAKYRLIAKTSLFQGGLARLRKGLETQRVALLCAEKDPLTCHRTILVTRALRHEDIEIGHILADGGLEPNAAAEARLLKLVGVPEGDLFTGRATLTEVAYDLQAEKIAYKRGQEEEVV